MKPHSIEIIRVGAAKAVAAHLRKLYYRELYKRGTK